MARVDYHVSGDLRVVSPVHVGSGEFRSVSTVRNKNTNKNPLVASIIRDFECKPWLPPTTIKGWFRRVAEGIWGAGSQQVRFLFGNIVHHDEATGAMGAIQFRGGQLVKAGSAERMPFVSEAVNKKPIMQGGLGPGVFIAARTRINRSTGTAADHTLFYQEFVAPDTVFRFRLVLTTRGDEDSRNRDRELLVSLLNRAARRGARIGKAQSAGYGEVSLVWDRLTLTTRTLARHADLQYEPHTLAPLEPDPKRKNDDCGIAINLICPGPFVILDASRSDTREANSRRADDQARLPQIAAQSAAGGTGPFVPGSSIKGVLRARCAFLETLANKNKGVPLSICDDGDFVLRHKRDIAGLSSTQRLFGVTGFRGFLAVLNIRSSGWEQCEISSVALDRFSGGPIDGGLFKTQTWFGGKLAFCLKMEGRGVVVPSAADYALFKLLRLDIEKNGLQLGHGTNKGFGWFSRESDG